MRVFINFDSGISLVKYALAIHPNQFKTGNNMIYYA